ISLGLVAACATSEIEEPAIQASERLECQKVAPPDYDACLERARTGTVLHVPDSVWQRDRKWNQRPFDCAWCLYLRPGCGSIGYEPQARYGSCCAAMAAIACFREGDRLASSRASRCWRSLSLRLGSS